MNLPNLAPVPFVAPRIREDGPVRSHLLALKAAAIREELEPTQEHLIVRGPVRPECSSGIRMLPKGKTESSVMVLRYPHPQTQFSSASVSVKNDCIILIKPAFGENSFRAPLDS